MCIDDCSNTSRRDVLASAAALALASTERAEAQTNPIGEPVSFSSGAAAVQAMLFRAQGRRRRPLVLMAHGNPGFDADYQAFCARVASANHTVLAVDWTAGGPPYPDDDAARQEWRRNTIGSDAFWDMGARNIAAGLAWAAQRRIAEADRPLAVGICGGGVVLGHWSAGGAPLARLVLFHAAARLQAERSATTPARDLVDLAAQIATPVQAHYGMLDQYARASDGRAFEAALAQDGAQPEFYYYPDAGHGFVLDGAAFDPDSNFGYVPFASQQAVSRALRFLVG